jgi:hypothetical protein
MFGAREQDGIEDAAAAVHVDNGRHKRCVVAQGDIKEHTPTAPVQLGSICTQHATEARSLNLQIIKNKNMTSNLDCTRILTDS